MPVVKNIKQKTIDNSFNTYPIGMNAEFITIPAGTANLYENNINADEGMSILKNYVDEQLSSARVSFFVDYTDMNNQVYNLRVYNDIYNNGQELRNTLNNLPQNISNLSIRQLYAPNFTNASGLLENRKDIYNINNIEFININNSANMFIFCFNLSFINNLKFGNNILNMANMFAICNNLINVPNFNTSNVKDMSWMFVSCSSLTNIPNFDTSNVTNMSGMFYDCYNLTNIPNFDTSNAKDMSGMFHTCGNLINVSNFDTSNVINMGWMFDNCYNLINVPNFDTSNVTSMYMMFSSCYNLINIPNFDTYNVTNMYAMLEHCYNLISVPKFNTSKVTNMGWMFSGCNNLINVSNFNTSNVKEIGLIFLGCPNLSNSSILNIANSLPYYNNIINANKYNTLDYIGFSDEQISVIINNSYVSNYVENHGWSLPKVNYELAYTNVNSPNTWINYNLLNQPITSNAKTLRDAFRNKDIDTANIVKLNVINLPGVTNGSYLFAYNGNNYNFSKMTNVEHLNMQDLQNASHLFYNDRNLINISNLNTSNVTSMGSMFNSCRNLINIPNLNTSNVMSMSSIFNGCFNLITIPNFDTSNVTNMSNMFNSCQNLINIPNFNTSNVTDMYSMFRSCYNLTTIPSFNTSNVTSMSNMFYMCYNLSNQSIDNIAYSLPLYENIINGNPSITQYIGLSHIQINNMNLNAKQAAENKGWDILPKIRVDYTYTNGVNGTNKIYNIDTMTGEQQYQNLYNLFDSQLDVTKIANIKIISSDNKISNMYSLFNNMRQVTNINIQMNTSNVTNMSDLFFDCWSLKSVPELDTTKVINMRGIFRYCSNLKNIPNLDTSKVMDMYGMFYSCTNLTNIPNLNTLNVTNMYWMFYDCFNLISVPILNMSKVISINDMFYGCNNLSSNSLQNIIMSIPDRDQITGTTSTTNLQYIGLSATQINNLSTYYKQIAADKGWYVEGYEPKYTEMLVGTANALGDITFEDTETYPMTLTYDDMFGDYCLENTNQGKASTTSSATLTVSEDLLNVFDPMFRFLVYYSSETDYDFTRIYKNGDLLYEYSGYNGTTSYLDTTFWLEVKVGDVLKFEYEKDSSGDHGLDGCKIYISGWKNNKSYEVRYSTVDAPTTYITKFIPKEDN